MQAARHSQSIENTVSIFGNRASLSEKVTTVQKSVAGERLRKINSNGFGEVGAIEDERGMSEEAWRLFRKSLLSVLIDAQSADLRVQGLAWYPEFRRCSGGSCYSPIALGESSFDHLNLTIC